MLYLDPDLMVIWYIDDNGVQQVLCDVEDATENEYNASMTLSMGE